MVADAPQRSPIPTNPGIPRTSPTVDRLDDGASAEKLGVVVVQAEPAVFEAGQAREPDPLAELLAGDGVAILIPPAAQPEFVHFPE